MNTSKWLYFFSNGLQKKVYTHAMIEIKATVSLFVFLMKIESSVITFKLQYFQNSIKFDDIKVYTKVVRNIYIFNSQTSALLQSTI